MARFLLEKAYCKPFLITMNINKSLISAVLLVSFAVMPFKAHAWFLDIFDPLRVNKIMAKAKSDPELTLEKINEFILEENWAYAGFVLIQKSKA